MTTRTLLAAAALAVAASPLSGTVAQAQPGAPITVTACGIDATPFTPLQPFENVRFASDVRISFVNAASLPATSVSFAVRFGARTQTVVADGPFAPGAGATQSLDVAPGPLGDGTAQCDVVAVTFADGTSWPGGN